MNEIQLDPSVFIEYQKTWEINRAAIAQMTRYPWAQERADQFLLLYHVEAVTPLGRVHARVVFGAQVPAVEALVQKLRLEHVPAQAGKERGIAITTTRTMPLIQEWDGPVGF